MPQEAIPKPGDNPQTLAEYLGAKELGNSWELPTDIAVIGPAENELTNRLRALGWEEEEVWKLGIAFREILVNAIAHGNLEIGKKIDERSVAELAAEKLAKNPALRNVKIEVDIEADGKKLLVKVRDHGKGFDPKDVKDPTSNKELLNTEGRGIYLLKEFVNSVRFEPSPHGTTVIMERVRGTATHSEPQTEP